MTLLATDAAHANLPLRMLPLRLRCRATTLRLAGFAGPLWRSGFGMALQRHFPEVFALFFDDGSPLARLYALRPPHGAVVPGGRFELGINLFGPACDHALACTQAMAMLGETGLGTPRGHFALEQARIAGRDAPFLETGAGLRAWPEPLREDECPWTQPAGSDELDVRLLTPLRIKNDDDVCRQAPALDLLLRRLYGRMTQLCEAAGERVPPVRVPTPAELRHAASLRPVASELSWLEVRRRSSRTQQKMQFGGLVGWLRFRGELAPYRELLALGEIMQLGGKTTFGFGCMEHGFSREG